MIKVRSYDLKSILILTIFKIFLLIEIIMMFFSEQKDEQIPIIPIAIILGVIVFLSMLQILIYLFTFKKLLINELGITVFEKSFKKIFHGMKSNFLLTTMK